MNFRYFVISPLLLTILIICTQIHAEEKKIPNIGIIGAGIGGTSASYFLRELFGKDVNIDVYEKSNVGGRLATINIGGKIYESGGSIIHAKNAYMVNFTKYLGLDKLPASSGHFAIYDGQIVFDGSKWSAIQTAKLMWRYGWNLIRLQNHISKLLSKFDRIYEHQRLGFAYTSPERLLESMDSELLEMLHYSLEEVLAHEDFSRQFIDELAMGAMMNNYGQTVDAQAFVGSVSLAGAEGDLWAVSGGNKQVPERLLKNSKAKLIKSKVNKITLKQNEEVTYELTTDKSVKEYDIVVLATPLQDNLAEIVFEGIEIGKFPQHYHQTIATVVRGIPNFAEFGYKTLHEFPDMLLVNNPQLSFKSIGKLHSVNPHSASYKAKQELPTWKVFSQKPLTDEDMNKLFASYEETKVVTWKAAYPKYKSAEVDITKFKLGQQLYYVNAIEFAASAMEMGAIGGKNVALLAYNDWNRKNDHIDPKVYDILGKHEL